MTRQPQQSRTAKTWQPLSAIACLLTLSPWSIAPAIAQGSSPRIPTELQVPSGQVLLSKVRAEGDQIYICQANSEKPEQFQWVLKAPEAKLLQDGNVIGQHYAGPAWESQDGSKIIGQVKAKVNAPEADAIPWLLLAVKTREGGGRFSQVNWVQRLQTSGGQAPAAGCDRTQVNATVRVGYSADYWFYGDRPQRSWQRSDNGVNY